MKDVRYDRQLRLWGEEGQSSIEAASVCVLGSSALGTEILKCLVLAGVHSVCVIDDAVVMSSDLGQNFFVTEEDVGKSRAETTLRYLKELNPSVSGESLSLSPSVIVADELSRLLPFSVVVAVNLPDETCAPISEFLFPAGVPFISARVYGFLGYLRICVQEHTIAHNHDENPQPDLRLDQPFEALSEIVSETANFDEMNAEQLKHTPYILLYFKALQKYRDTLGDSKAFPRSYAERKNFLACLWQLRVPGEDGRLDSANFDEAKAALARSVQATTVPSDVQSVISDPKCSDESTACQPFWLICSGLRRFVEEHGVLPLSGVLPDMTSDSQRYTHLATAFHDKALADAAEVLEYTKEIEAKRGVGDIISQEQCYRFCKNAAFIRLQRGSSMSVGEDYKAVLEQICQLEPGDAPTPAVWLFLLKAADKFAIQKARYPGTNGVPCTIDSMDLQQRVNSLIKQAQMDVATVTSRISADAVAEMCRYGAGEPHVVASLLGGIAAQEVIKLATNQYVPLNNTLLFDGHNQSSATFRL